MLVKLSLQTKVPGDVQVGGSRCTGMGYIAAAEMLSVTAHTLRNFDATFQVDRKLENVAVIIFTNGDNECREDSLHTNAIESIRADGELFRLQYQETKVMMQPSG